MKNFKRILAIVLVVMMVVPMLATGLSAATAGMSLVQTNTGAEIADGHGVLCFFQLCPGRTGLLADRYSIDDAHAEQGFRADVIPYEECVVGDSCLLGDTCGRAEPETKCDEEENQQRSGQRPARKRLIFGFILRRRG